MLPFPPSLAAAGNSSLIFKRVLKSRIQSLLFREHITDQKNVVFRTRGGKHFLFPFF